MHTHAADNEYFWAWDKMYDIVHNEPDLAWELILRIMKADNSAIGLANLAAGPLEDLLGLHGDKIIERAEKEAVGDSQFKYLLGGVWKNMMTGEIWDRVQKARGKIIW